MFVPVQSAVTTIFLERHILGIYGRNLSAFQGDLGENKAKQNKHTTGYEAKLE